MSNISLRQVASILGSNTVIGMARRVGLKPPPPPISVRNLVNLVPLLQLQGWLKYNIVAATQALNAVFGCDNGCTNQNQGQDLNEAQVNSFFTGPGPWKIDCLGAARIILARGLILTLNPGEFDKLGYTTSNMHLINRPINTAEEMLVGEWAYFKNDPKYLQKHPGGGYQGENVIKVSDSEYYGFPGGTKTAQQWIQELISAYNAGLPASEQINNIPGFLGQVNTCFDVDAVSIDLMNLRGR